MQRITLNIQIFRRYDAQYNNQLAASKWMMKDLPRKDASKFPGCEDGASLDLFDLSTPYSGGPENTKVRYELADKLIPFIWLSHSYGSPIGSPGGVLVFE